MTAATTTALLAVAEAARLHLDADSAALLRPSKDTESAAVKARNALKDALSRV